MTQRFLLLPSLSAPQPLPRRSGCVSFPACDSFFESRIWNREWTRIHTNEAQTINQPFFGPTSLYPPATFRSLCGLRVSAFLFLFFRFFRPNAPSIGDRDASASRYAIRFLSHTFGTANGRESTRMKHRDIRMLLSPLCILWNPNRRRTAGARPMETNGRPFGAWSSWRIKNLGRVAPG